MSLVIGIITFVLVRHGQTDWGAEHRLQGNTDESVLTEKGIIQSEQVAQDLLKEFQGREVEVWSAGLQRTDKTAEIIARVFMSEVYRDPRFKEANHGRLNGLTSDQYENDPEYLAHKSLSGEERFKTPLSPGGESQCELAERAKQAMKEIGRINPERVRIIITCGGVMNGLFKSILGQYDSKVKFGNCERLVIELDIENETYILASGQVEKEKMSL